jgi:hypothetical protein
MKRKPNPWKASQAAINEAIRHRIELEARFLAKMEVSKPKPSHRGGGLYTFSQLFPARGRRSQ